ncbi:MAG: amidohydrolase [Tidjanibacter sp.]|nr:amidohydrolase [Tidjanibacter sp.]
MEIKWLTDEVLGDYVGLVNRYYGLHSHPELSFAEYHTAEQIVAHLRSRAIECWPIAGTGVLAKIVGTAPDANPQRAIVLRADIDALPIAEQSASPSPSQREGVMHACGHDLHTTVLLGALATLARHSDKFGCTIFGLFQPGEELNPGGATMVLAENPFEGYEVVAFVGEHVEPTLPTGTIGICSGRYMAACDELHITIKGHGGHAALRGGIVDPILPASQLIEQLYKIPTQSPDKTTPTILSIGRIEALGATNIVPDNVSLQGTIRTFEEGWRSEVKSLVSECCRRIEAQYGVMVEENFGCGYPAVYNAPSLAEDAVGFLTLAFGEGAVERLGIRPTGEDFGYYTERYPSLFYRLGVGYVDDDFVAARAGALHTASFCPDTKAIGHGVVTMVLLALHFADR